MFKQHSVFQDGPLEASGRVREVIRSVVSGIRFDRMRAAVAYASAIGCEDLSAVLSKASFAWETAEKKWLLSIDFGHTDPRAIRYLKSLPKSQVRIHDGNNVLRRRLVPAAAFHPKTFVFDRAGGSGPRPLGFVLGSANLTSGGLDTNIEHVVGMRFSSTIGKDEKLLFGPVSSFEEWWDLAWLTADPATTAFLKKYQTLRKRYRPRVRDRRGPAPRRKLPASVNQMRSFARWGNARCFWIETGNMYENNKRGNQLDARRGTRVYFGFPYRPVRPQTTLGKVKMKYGKRPVQTDRSIAFGKNSMDKVHLPVPGTYGPSQYDHSVIHFKRVGPREFAVSLGNSRSAATWRRKSKQQGLLNRLGGGRRFGFYS